MICYADVTAAWCLKDTGPKEMPNLTVAIVPGTRKEKKVQKGEKGEGAARTRPKVWLDDVRECFEFAFEKFKASNTSDHKLTEVGEAQTKAICTSICLEFCFAGKVQLNKVEYTQWSVLRAKMQELIVAACHSGAGRVSAEAGVSVVSDQVNVEEVLMSTLQSIQPKEKSDTHSADSFHTTYAKYNLLRDSHNQTKRDDMIEFFKKNDPSEPIKMHPDYNCIRKLVWTKLSEDHTLQTAEAVVSVYRDCLLEHFAEMWVQFAGILHQLNTEMSEDKFPDWARGIISMDSAPFFVNLPVFGQTFQRGP